MRKMPKGTQWVIKTPRLKCRCGTTLHFECRGRWAIKYDSAPSSIPSLTLPSKQDIYSRLIAKYEQEVAEQEPPPSAKNDSDG